MTGQYHGADSGALPEVPAFLLGESDSNVPALPVIDLPFTPSFVRNVGSMASGVSFGRSIVDLFGRAGVSLDVEGGTPPKGGVVVACDHSKRVEPLVIQALADAWGYDASHVVAMPTSLAGRIMQATGDKGRNLVLPVMPMKYATERLGAISHGPLTSHRLRRNPDLTRSQEELGILNRRALGMAAHIASRGGMVSIFPAANKQEAAACHWFSGLGRIIAGVPGDAAGNTHVAVARTEGFSAGGLLTAVTASSLGLRLPEQRVVVRAEVLGTVADIMDSIPGTVANAAHADVITSAIKQRYVRAFAIP